MDDEIIDEFLAHYGVKGMHWGQRKSSGIGVSRKTDREARKDAEEHARAKLFFGEGAGTRRKLSKATVQAKKAKDPDYAKAFDHHLSKQDLSKHASGARTERKRTDRKDKTKKRAGYLARRFTGEMGTQAAFTAAVLAGGAFLTSPKGRALTKTTVNRVKNYASTRNGQKATDFVSSYFNRNT